MHDGPRVRLGGQRSDRGGAFVEPTLRTKVARDKPAHRLELFGLVAMVFRGDDKEGAIALAIACRPAKAAGDAKPTVDASSSDDANDTGERGGDTPDAAGATAPSALDRATGQR